MIYDDICNKYFDVDKMLIHSRYKRCDRAKAETMLKDVFNNSTQPCIVVSTQVVEVSLDISFDVMVTECAPIDAMIQRFGRINRKRTDETIGKYKDIYVIKPPENKEDSKPYDLQVLQKSFDVLPDGKVLNETELQTMIDTVYPDIPILDIKYSGAVFVDGKWRIRELCHNAKSALLDVLDINSVVCITESDRQQYINNAASRTELEIPISYKSIMYKKLEQINQGSRPYIVANDAYSIEKGLMTELIK